MQKLDTLFSSPVTKLNDWTFNEQVTEVFSNMIQRSIPGYSNIISMIGMLAKRLVQPNSQIYDLGCSLGTATLSIRKNITVSGCNIIAIDSSSAMIDHCNNCINTSNAKTSVQVIKANVLDIPIENASMVVLNFTLQFIALSDRLRLLSRIYRGLREHGVLVLSEKLSFEDTDLHKLLFNMHHDFKRTNGYSRLEIIQKHNMLKHVMLTESIEAHKSRLKQAGFNHTEIWFQCLNFGSLIALKKA
ncbi:tRNA cmo(5)U34 methyltransferase, SAM-dependent [Serratia symbiotica str. 'Cinara cedri']|nr:tRNA cmo(5)U34 methyltransferase, SAM-dependent [Serratia symbiotica str. 'Cinara cedri']